MKLQEALNKYRADGNHLAVKILEFTHESLDGCWLWTRKPSHHGYAVIRHEGKTLRAHRVMLEIHKGKLAENLFACHKCDVRHCVNPDHLFVGTCQDNNRDMIQKGRQARGEELPQSKLTEEIVAFCRDEYRAGRRLWALCDLFGVDSGTLSPAVTGKTWRHVKTPPVHADRKGGRAACVKLTETQVRDIISLRGKLSHSKMAVSYGVTKGTISHILSARTWKHIARIAAIMFLLVGNVFGSDFLSKLAWIESRGHNEAIGDHGRSLGTWQMSEAAWLDVTSLRASQGLPTFDWCFAHNDEVAREYCCQYLSILSRQFQAAHHGRCPTERQLIGLYQRGFRGMARRGFCVKGKR